MQAAKEQERTKATQKIKSLENKLESQTDKFISDHIDPETYKKHKGQVLGEIQDPKDSIRIDMEFYLDANIEELAAIVKDLPRFLIGFRQRVSRTFSVIFSGMV